MVVDRKKPEGTSSAIFGVGTAAKCCELKGCADPVGSRTDNKDEIRPSSMMMIMMTMMMMMMMMTGIILFPSNVVFANVFSNKTEMAAFGIHHSFLYSLPKIK